MVKKSLQMRKARNLELMTDFTRAVKNPDLNLDPHSGLICLVDDFLEKIEWDFSFDSEKRAIVRTLVEPTIYVQVAKINWHSSYEASLQWITVKTFPESLYTAVEIDAIRLALVQSRRFFRVCSMAQYLRSYARQ